MGDTSLIKVAEHFYTIQGEGRYAGTPAVFLRLAGCNLSCGWHDDLEDYAPGEEPQGDATWVCDTIDVWRSPRHTYKAAELARSWDACGWIDTLRDDDTHLILTGGEPTLPAHQQAFVAFYDHLDTHHDVTPFVEVETNGTQHLTPEFDDRVDHYNVSLKLANSGMDEDRRIDAPAIAQYTAHGPGSAMFKFVVSAPSDVEEIHQLIDDHEIPREQISLMPAGQTQSQLRDTYPIVAELCKEHHYQFSPRLHVDTWNLATGV